MSWTNEFVGYQPGLYIVLHTFGRDLKFNPHFHVIVTVGGLSFDKKRWIYAPKGFLMLEKIKSFCKLMTILSIPKGRNIFIELFQLWIKNTTFW